MSNGKLKAVVFDLFNTLGRFPEVISDNEASSFLVGRGYEVYPQAFRHAFGFTVFIDYPRHGFEDFESTFRKMFERLQLDVDEATVRELSKIYGDVRFELFPEAVEAVRKAKALDMKTAIATTTPKFWFEEDIAAIADSIDFICTGYEAGSEKSNPRMYRRIMDALDVEPGETVVIGDDIDLDVRNPKGLGMRAIHIDEDQDSKTKIADAVVGNVSEAMKI
ncbi:MAG: HAD family hydrolase, partial [Candidatus Bathyarchaeota archaeon]|nr:HAD family hydrolase [Candidatus Bathyarchaeota archaeon]